jgi:hypothetical protein
MFDFADIKYATFRGFDYVHDTCGPDPNSRHNRKLHFNQLGDISSVWPPDALLSTDLRYIGAAMRIEMATPRMRLCNPASV